MTQDTPADDGREVLLAGAAAYQRGEVAEALRIFEQAARTGTGALRLSALINAASMADELGEHTTAIGWYREALAEIPADAVEKRASALINYSQALQHLGELDEAQSALEAARTLLATADAQEHGMLRVACLLSLSAVSFHRGQWMHTIELSTESLDAAVRFAPQLAGHPLMNLAGAYFEIGNRDLAVDFAAQALAAFESAGDHNAVAETQQNQATMLVRLNRFDEAEPLLRASQQYFERTGLGHRAGVGLKTMGYLAEGRDLLDEARELYRRSFDYFHASGAVLDAADVQVRLATVAFLIGEPEDGEQLLGAAFHAYAERGLGLHCAQIDFWHASLLEAVIDTMPAPPAHILTAAADLAVTSAVAIDAVRHTFANGHQREQWNRQIADPAMRLAFRFAYLCGNGPLIADLIETQCAGAALNIDRSESRHSGRLPLDLLEPPADPAAERTPPHGAATDGNAAHRRTSTPVPPAGPAAEPIPSHSATTERTPSHDVTTNESGAHGVASGARTAHHRTSTPVPPTDPAAEPIPSHSATTDASAAHHRTDGPADSGATADPHPAAVDDRKSETGQNPKGPTLMAGTASPAADRRTGTSALQLGAALAEIAAGAGLPVAPPPRLAVAPDGHIALAAYIAAAEQRYGRRVRDNRVVPA
ncbi:tetratricopeptide repeat protein [Nocardia sp. NPDC050710]|uniref:tetratricopeptide repeat protein n=1 Tax=Nocardia sp. NPDC050710 TaxID=3157220 RepID=UPI0033DE8DFD